MPTLVYSCDRCILRVLNCSQLWQLTSLCFVLWLLENQFQLLWAEHEWPYFYHQCFITTLSGHISRLCKAWSPWSTLFSVRILHHLVTLVAMVMQFCCRTRQMLIVAICWSFCHSLNLHSCRVAQISKLVALKISMKLSLKALMLKATGCSVQNCSSSQDCLQYCFVGRRISWLHHCQLLIRDLQMDTG